jgi:hypothetical protein
VASQACSMNCGCAALGVEGIFDRGGFGVEMRTLIGAGTVQRRCS